MKLYHRVVREGTYVKGVECFNLTGDKKNPTNRVAFFDYKVHGSVVSTGNCKCGGKVLQLIKSPVDWSVCEKCGKDHSTQSFPRRLVGVS